VADLASDCREAEQDAEGIYGTERIAVRGIRAIRRR